MRSSHLSSHCVLSGFHHIFQSIARCPLSTHCGRGDTNRTGHPASDGLWSTNWYPYTCPSIYILELSRRLVVSLHYARPFQSAYTQVSKKSRDVHFDHRTHSNIRHVLINSNPHRILSRCLDCSTGAGKRTCGLAVMQSYISHCTTYMAKGCHPRYIEGRLYWARGEEDGSGAVEWDATCLPSSLNNATSIPSVSSSSWGEAYFAGTRLDSSSSSPPPPCPPYAPSQPAAHTRVDVNVLRSCT